MPHRRISDALGLAQRDSLLHYQMQTQGRPLWPIDWRYLVYVLLDLAWYGDSRQLRALIATASLGWGVLLFANPTSIVGPNYALLRLLPTWLWASVFLLHGIGAWWRIFERRPRVKIAFAINFVGVMVWLAATSAINWAAGHPVIGSTLEWFSIVLLAFAAINTARNEERGTP